jgi:EmrB/QacA subfamily drug resistance transporter
MLRVRFTREQYFAFARAHSVPMVMARMSPRTIVFSAMLLAIFIVAVEATIVATALPTIVGDLGGLRYFSWVFGAYLLTQAVTIPIYGRLADFFGRKTLLIIAILIFLTGSILCGFAHNMLELILFRALQGLGAGGVQPVSTTIVGDLYIGRDRARAQGYMSTTWAFAAIIGPLLGAFIIQHFGWPVIFWLNVPTGLACIAVALRAYHETIKRVAHQIDYLGSALLTIGVGGLMYVLVDAGNMPLAAALPLTGIALGALALLIRHELHTAEPMMPFSLYRIRVIAIANIGNVFIGSMVIGISTFLPTFVQGAMSRSAVDAGIAIGALFVGWTPGSIFGARFQLRYSFRWVAVAGTVPLLIGCGVLATLNVGSDFTLICAGLALLGFGFGLFNSVFVVATQGAVGWEMRGSATSSLIFMRQIGQAVGSAMFGAVFNLGLYSRVPDAGGVVATLIDPARRAALPGAELTRLTSAIADSLHGVYLIIFGFSIVMGALAIALPSGLRAAHATAAQGRESA